MWVAGACGSSDCDGSQDMKRSGKNGRIYPRVRGDGGDRGSWSDGQTLGAVKMSTAEEREGDMV